MENLWIIYGYGWWLNPTTLKNMSSSVGMMKFSMYGEKKKMFPTTNQYFLFFNLDLA